MSVLNKLWKIKNTSQDSILKKLLSNRGLQTDAEIQQFFHPEESRDFHDPFLMKDMERAVARIGSAIEKSERIMIFGDYDVDGITGTAILMRALTKLGANVSYRLPHRIEDGYGLRKKFIEEFARLGVKILITVDNGISCFDETAAANTAGIDVILTDHHTIPEKIPAAYAILHPKLPDSGYPFTELTGAGVALKLAQALYTKRLAAGAEPVKDLLDLACMGTIGDLGPMLGENRYIVKEGLKVLENTRWPGLSRLKESAGIKGRIDTHAIGFLLGPRINAAGRISHPSHALQLLLNGDSRGDLLAKNLEQLNRKRQNMMMELSVIAEELARNQINDPVIIVKNPAFHGGVIGLIAAKLCDKYSRPAIAMEVRDKTYIGSCRSIQGINIVEALTAAKKLLTHFGGHAAAAGFDLPKANFEKFQKLVKSHVGKLLNAKECKPTIDIDCEILDADITKKTIEMLRWFEPFGVSNEKPRFLCKNLTIKDFSTVGAEKKHLKIVMKTAGAEISGIGFSLGKFAAELRGKKQIDAVFELEENYWNGKTSLQLVIRDFRISRKVAA